MALRLTTRCTASRRPKAEPTKAAEKLLELAAQDYAASGDVRERMDRRDRINRALYGGGES